MTTEANAAPKMIACRACGLAINPSRAGSELCEDCEAVGIKLKMTAQQMVQQTRVYASAVEEERDELAKDHERDEILLQAVEQWFRARNVVNRDEKQLANTEEDLAGTARWYFG